ncbi:hypothetical protein VTN96DRAFT_845 [Rasamsonia emersonii]
MRHNQTGIIDEDFESSRDSKSDFLRSNFPKVSSSTRTFPRIHSVVILPTHSGYCRAAELGQRAEIITVHRQSPRAISQHLLQELHRVHDHRSRTITPLALLDRGTLLRHAEAGDLLLPGVVWLCSLPVTSSHR